MIHRGGLGRRREARRPWCGDAAPAAMVPRSALVTPDVPIGQPALPVRPVAAMRHPERPNRPRIGARRPIIGRSARSRFIGRPVAHSDSVDYDDGRAPVAQWIERGRPKACVGGSNPSGGAIDTSTASASSAWSRSCASTWDCSPLVRSALSQPSGNSADDVHAARASGIRIRAAQSLSDVTMSTTCARSSGSMTLPASSNLPMAAPTSSSGSGRTQPPV